MAKFRKVWSTFWGDPFIEQLTPEEKYFFLFLLTNPEVTACGIYMITKRKMAFYTGYNNETVDKLLLRFETSGKIKYDLDTSELMIVNWARYNLLAKGKPVLDCLRSELQHVRSQSFIQEMAASVEVEEVRSVYESFHGPSTVRTTQGGQDGDGDGDGDEFNSIVEEVVNFLNSETDSSFKKTTNKTRTLIRARLADGFTLDDFNAVIRYKSREWRGTKHDKFLRPETLFGTKFEGYLQASQRAPVLVPDQINVGGFTVQRDPGSSMEGSFKRLLAKTHKPDTWLKEREQMGLVNVYPRIYEHVWQTIGAEA